MGELKRDEALERAIGLAGGVAALARFINTHCAEDRRLTTQAISQWKRCPQSRVLLVEKATANAAGIAGVTRYELRPDIYPEERGVASSDEFNKAQQKLDLAVPSQ